MVSASHEALLTKKEVLEKFNVCLTTLWNWERKDYLIPVKIGRKVSYRQADIERIIAEAMKAVRATAATVTDIGMGKANILGGLYLQGNRQLDENEAKVVWGLTHQKKKKRRILKL